MSNSMAEFFYNSKEGTVLGRTASSWAKIGFFYLVYYTFLAFLAYGTVAWYQSTVEDEKTPYIRTRTGQPGMAIEPADSVIADNNNNNFEFDSSNPESFKPYVDRSIEFLSKYSPSIQDQFTEAKLKSAMEQKSVYYFLKVNKINGWTPIGYKSAKQMAGEGYHFEDGSPVLNFDENNKIQKEDGIYFYCNSTSDGVTFEFENLQDYTTQLIRPKTPKTYGFISKAEYEKLNRGFEKRRKWEAIGSLTAPFVALKVTAEYTTINKLACYSLARNIQVQRHINVGYYEFGFTAQ
jgi:hypothetical protein